MADLVTALEVFFPNSCSDLTVRVVEISASVTSGTPALNVAPTDYSEPKVCVNDSSSVTVVEKLKDTCA